MHVLETPAHPAHRKRKAIIQLRLYGSGVASAEPRLEGLHQQHLQLHQQLLYTSKSQRITHLFLWIAYLIVNSLFRFDSIPLTMISHETITRRGPHPPGKKSKHINTNSQIPSSHACMHGPWTMTAVAFYSNMLYFDRCHNKLHPVAVTQIDPKRLFQPPLPAQASPE